MRVLNFKVEGQRLNKQGDFSGLVKGTSNYLVAHFDCGRGWNKCIKMAIFNERVPVRVSRDNTCIIPAEVLASELFSVRLVGIASGGYKIRTNMIEVMQGR